MSYTSFRDTVWRYYRVHGRHDLPWRPPSLKLRRGKEDDLVYKIFVSEVMLQQTQVERVIPFYTRFVKKFPTARALAAVPLADVLRAWQGLGYNRRAQLLRDAAKGLANLQIRTHASTRGPLVLVEELEKLPGVGPYTARAVAAFAYNVDVVFVETNIRTAVLHHFFSNVGSTRPYIKISDREIEAILEKALPRGKAREWYSALMDYGAHLKRSGVKVNAKSKHYTKQSKFEGSLRQVRGAILKALTIEKCLTEAALSRRLKNHRGVASMIPRALAALTKDGLIKKKRSGWRIA